MEETMNAETLVMKELVLNFYREQFSDPATQYLNDLRRIRAEKDMSLERAIIELYEYVTNSLMEKLFARYDSAHVPSSRDKANVSGYFTSPLHIGANGDPSDRKLEVLEGFGMPIAPAVKLK